MRSRKLHAVFLAINLLLTVTSWAQSAMTADAWAEDARLNQPVSVQSPGGPMNELLARLTKDYGIELSAASSTQDDLIVLMVSEQPLSTVMQKIASHFNFSWERMGDGAGYQYRLYQSEQAAQAEARAYDEQVLRDLSQASWRKQINRQLSKMNSTRAEAYAEIEKLIKQAESQKDAKKRSVILRQIKDYQGILKPGAQLLLALLKSFSPRDWERAQAKEGLTFSTHPWGEEKPLPLKLLPIAQKEADRQGKIERKKVQAQQKKKSAGNLPKLMTVGGVKVRFEFGPRSNAWMPVILYDAALKKSETYSFYVSFNTFDWPEEEWLIDRPALQKRLSKLVASTSRALKQMPPLEEGTVEVKQPPLKELSQSPIYGASITIPEIMKEKGKETDSGSGKAGDFVSDLFEEINWFRERLKESAQREPLEWSGYAPLLKNIHEQAGLNVISDGFDAYVYASAGFPSFADALQALAKAQTLAEVLNALAYTEDYRESFEIDSTLDQNQKWLMLKKRDHASARANQISRPLLRKWAKRLFEEPSIEDYAELAADLKREKPQEVTGLLVYAVDLSKLAPAMLEVEVSGQSSFDDRSLELLSVYATLTDEQKAKAASAKGLSISEMSALQQAQFKTLLRSNTASSPMWESLADPLQTINASKLTLVFQSKTYSGYRMESLHKGQFPGFRLYFPEERYQEILKGLEESDPPSDTEVRFTKGKVVSEKLLVASETPFKQAFYNQRFFPETPVEEKSDNAETPKQNAK